MASTSHLLFGLFFLLFAMSMPTIIQSKSTGSGNPFGFIQHLEGCHKGQNISGLHDVKRYLENFGYLNYDHNSGHKNHANDDEFDDLLESAVRKYQRSYHLNVTGSLDSNTVNQMMKPRCGVADFVNGTKQNHHKHTHKSGFHTVGHYQFFFPGPRKWSQSRLTYRFDSSAPVPASLNLRSVIQQAFNRWAQVSHFTFQEVPANSNANIVIGFHRRSHGDGSPFDGPRGVLAHANPPIGGNCHFDADERWSTNPGQYELDLESVAVHEIGHLLGLNHEPGKQDAIMYPTFSYGLIKRDLNADDIQGIQVLYGLQ